MINLTGFENLLGLIALKNKKGTKLNFMPFILLLKIFLEESAMPTIYSRNFP